jgi:transcriptional regulator with XRE-family HTH domain
MPAPRKSIFAAPYVGIVLRLIERRLSLGMTQWDVARALGEDQSFVSRVERRQRRLDAYEFAMWCAILKLDPAALLDPIVRDARRRLAKSRRRQ